MKLSKEELDKRLVQIKEKEGELDKLKDEVKEHTILTKIEDLFGEIEMMTDVIEEIVSGKRYVLADMETQKRYNDCYDYVQLQIRQVKKGLILSSRTVPFYVLRKWKHIGKLEDLLLDNLEN